MMIKKGKEGQAKKIKNPLPPIDRNVHLLLREYCLYKTRESGHLVTQGTVIEEAILNLVNSSMNKKIKGD